MKFRKRTGSKTPMPKYGTGAPYTIYLCCDCCPPNAHPAHMAPCGRHEAIETTEMEPELLTEEDFYKEMWS